MGKIRLSLFSMIGLALSDFFVGHAIHVTQECQAILFISYQMGIVIALIANVFCRFLVFIQIGLDHLALKLIVRSAQMLDTRPGLEKAGEALTLRDYFAAKAMQASLSAFFDGAKMGGTDDQLLFIQRAIPRDAYAMADLMLEERAKEKK